MRIVLCCLVVLALVAGSNAINMHRAFARGPADCPAIPELPGDQKCKDSKGSCFFSGSCNCNGEVKTGLCGGGAGRKCCVGKVEMKPEDSDFVNICKKEKQTPEDKKCGAIAPGAMCVDATKCGCEMSFVSGKCGGAATRKCCPGKLRQEDNRADVDPRTNDQAPVRPRGTLPFKCADLFGKYPQGESPDVRDNKILPATKGQNDWITNTCALRMSFTLSSLGVPLPPKKGTDGGNLRLNAANGKYAYFRVAVLDGFMREKFGLPSKEIVKPGKNKLDNLGVDPAEFSKVKGIIRFNIPIWSDASGHFDIWDGTNMLEEHHKNPETKAKYFSNARSVAVWACQE